MKYLFRLSVLLSCVAMTTIWAQVTPSNDINNKTVVNTIGHNVVKVSAGSTHAHYAHKN